ncbi:MAG: cyclic nucleotide-binding domain-containing protein [Magnetococcales bacterium]|nr:cyclic nucleotide-binding domain-containing protein [Magnetococcales bacterium]
MLEEQIRQPGTPCQAGEVLYRQGEPAGEFYVVQQGRVLISRATSSGQSLLLEVGEGEVFGMAALFTASRQRCATARTATDAIIQKVEARLLMERLQEDPSLAFRVMRHLAQRIIDLDPVLPATPRQRLNVHDFTAGHHFLIVEDEIEFFALMQAWLREDRESGNPSHPLATSKLTHVTSFQDAERLLTRDKFDLILLDLNLSDRHGFQEIFPCLKELALDTPIIVFTGMDDDKQAMLAVEDGAQDYLVKGQVSRKSFNRAIRNALSRHNLLQKNRPVRDALL